MCAHGSRRTENVRSPSAIVRAVCVGFPAAAAGPRGTTRRRPRRAPAPPRSPAASGSSAASAAAIPEIRPPPDTGTSTTATSGASSAISRPMVPWPAITSRWSNGGTIGRPVCACSSLGTGEPLLQRHQFDGGAQGPGGVDLAARRVVRDDDVRGRPRTPAPHTRRPGRGCPTEWARIPRALTVGVEAATAFTAPRILNAPIGCSDSGLSHRSGHGERSSGVRTA